MAVQLSFNINGACYRELIAFVEEKNGVVMEEWKGYVFASMFFLTAVVNSFFLHQLHHIGMTLGMRIKASLVAAVYKKVNYHFDVIWKKYTLDYRCV